MKKLIAFLITIPLMMQTVFAYSGASNWAKTELDKAEKYGLITDKIKDNMKAEITREEFAELAVRLYEISTGKVAKYNDGDTFLDTNNNEIYKAFDLKIVNGTDMEKRLFSPKEFTNREQVSAMFYRTILAVYPGSSFKVEGKLNFTDSNKISSFAIEPIKFMNKYELLKGANNKIDPKGRCTREMAVLISVRILEKLLDGTFEANISNDNNIKNPTNLSPEQIVINDYEILKGDYKIQSLGEDAYIFVSLDKLQYSLKIPYNSFYIFPEVIKNGNNIDFVWNSKNGVILKVEMELGSKEIIINGTAYDAGFAPIVEGDKIFINLAPFTTALDMEINANSSNDVYFIQYKEQFPLKLLIGTWSDVETNLFVQFEEIGTGYKSLPSFAQSFIFDSNGNYQLRMVAVGGFKDTFIGQKGKYKILGNVIMLYDIQETLYKGNPFQLIYKDKYLDKPEYLFIEDYNEIENKINIDGEWVNKK